MVEAGYRRHSRPLGAQPTCIGDEYAMPLIGSDQLDRHWARVGTGTESDTAHTGTSWITWLLTARGEDFRIFHPM
jgi:hypothetical protein